MLIANRNHNQEEQIHCGHLDCTKADVVIPSLHTLLFYFLLLNT